LVVALVFSFNKGLSRFTRTYEVRLRAESIGGLTERSSVLMSGVKVGAVREIELARDGNGVLIHLRIDERYRVRRDAKFHIEQVGFLGDQFVAIYAHGTTGPLLGDGEEVQIEQPFNFQAAARSATELIQKVGSLVDNLNGGVARLNATLLSDTTLTNASRTIWNLKDFSERALIMVDNVNGLVATNSAAIHQAVSNLVRFSTEVQMLAEELSVTVVSNRTGFTAAVRDLQATSQILKELAGTINEGRGVVGSLLRDEQLQSNVTQTLRNVAVLSSNLARYGLLYKPKKQKGEGVPPEPAYRGKSPF